MLDLGRRSEWRPVGPRPGTALGPSSFRLKYLESYAEEARTWLHDEAEVIDTAHLTPGQTALQIADAVNS